MIVRENADTMRYPVSLLIGLALLLGACTAPRTPPVIDVAAENAAIRWNARELREITPVRRLFLSDQEREEYALYDDDGGVRAEVLLIQSRGGDDVTLNPPWALRTVDRAIEEWRFNDRQVAETGELQQASLRKSALLYRAYRHTGTDRSCFGFHAGWDPRHDDRYRRPNNILFGYFCAAPGHTLSAKEREHIVSALSVRPDPREPVIRIVTPSLPSNAGTRGFPYRIARHYAPDDDTDDSALAD